MSGRGRYNRLEESQLASFGECRKHQTCVHTLQNGVTLKMLISYVSVSEHYVKKKKKNSWSMRTRKHCVKQNKTDF